MAILYADENFDYDVVQSLRTLGHDVLTVQEAGQRGQPDPDVLAFATAAQRAVLTFNRRDFIRLHKQTTAHAGIVACTKDDPTKLADRIHQTLATYGSLDNHLVRIVRPP